MKLNNKIFTILTIFLIISTIVIIKQDYLHNINFIGNIKINDANFLIYISVGYIIAYIFYILLVCIPNYVKNKKAEAMILLKLDNLYEKLCILIAIFEKIYYDNSNNVYDDIMYFKIISDRNFSDSDKFLGFMVTKDCLIGRKNYFTDCLNIINKIKSNVLFPYTNVELISWIENLQNVIVGQNNYYQISNSMKRNIDMDELGRQIRDLKILYNRKSFNTNMKMITYNCIPLNHMEISKFKKFYNDYSLEMEKLGLRNIKVQINISEID